MGTTTAVAGRRERNKARTRTSLLTAAQRLFAEHGFANTSISAISEAAEVSERTFFRYFQTKEDLLLPGVQSLLCEIEQALAARPAAEEPLVAIRAAVGQVIAGHSRPGQPGILAGGLDPVTVRALASRLAVVAMDWERRFGDLLVERLRAAGSPEPAQAIALRAAVIAAAATAACRAALRLYREGAQPGRPLAELIAEALDVLDAPGAPGAPGAHGAHGAHGAPGAHGAHGAHGARTAR